jgi:hypothetical protein
MGCDLPPVRWLVTNRGQIDPSSTDSTWDLPDNASLFCTSNDVDDDNCRDFWARQSDRSFIPKFGDRLDLFGISMQLWEQNILSQEGTGFLCIFFAITWFARVSLPWFTWLCRTKEDALAAVWQGVAQTSTWAIVTCKSHLFSLHIICDENHGIHGRYIRRSLTVWELCGR